MSTNKTTHYQLNQWEAEDRVLRTEFNQDNAKLDSALTQAAQERAELQAAIPKIVTGTYTGNGAASRTITVGFTPKAVLVCTISGLMYTPSGSGYVYGGLALEGHPVQKAKAEGSSVTNYNALEIVDNGFRVYCIQLNEYSAVYCNYNGTSYHYIAVG